MQQRQRTNLSTIGLALGATALLAAILHFWVSATAPSPPIEARIADTVVAIRDTTIERLTGNASLERPPAAVDRGRYIVVATSALGGFAFVFAVLGFVRNEPKRACVGAAVLGASAVLFPFVVGAIGAVIILLAVAILLGAFLG